MEEPYRLQTELLGPLPIINHFLSRLGLDERLSRWLDDDENWSRLPAGTVLGVVLRLLCLHKEPLYAVEERARPYDAELIGLGEAERELLNDDRVGRALTRLFLADRASLMTETVTAMIPAFGLDCSQLHNDSSSITLDGAYAAADGTPRGGVPTPKVARGYNKDHRPDLKQLLWILTVSADGAVPIAYRTEDGNQTDDQTHIATWDGLVQLLGRPDFLYIADSKLCTKDAMDHIARNHGRCVTVLPRTRSEDGDFRAWVVTQMPPWEEVLRRKGRRNSDPDDIWWAFTWPQPSADGYRICWYRSSSKTAQDAVSRTDRLHRAQADLTALADRLQSPRSRYRDPLAVEDAVKAILEQTKTAKLIRYTIAAKVEERFRQEKTGRPGANTRYRRITRKRMELTFSIDAAAVNAEAASDGCFPLITNTDDTDLTAAQLLEAYKYQPRLEQRHAELKGPMEVAPVFLKDIERIEALLLLEFLALLVRALIEREIRNAMAARGLEELSIYPEDRACKAPTAARIFDIFTSRERHTLFAGGELLQVFPPQLSPLQLQVLDLLGVPATAYTS